MKFESPVQDSNLSPACKVAVASGPAVTALLGRSYPVMSLLGETLAEVQGLLDSTPSGWITIR